MNKIISLDSLQRLIIAPLKRLIDKKVEKVDGKGLSTNDFTDEYKEKLVGLNTDGLASKEYVDGQLSNIIAPLVSTNKQVLTEAQQHQTRENLGLYYTDDTVIEILPEISLEYKTGIDENGDDYSNTAFLGDITRHLFEDGKTYVVTYDCIQYRCVAMAYERRVYLGDRNIPYYWDELEPDVEFSEPFLFYQEISNITGDISVWLQVTKPGIHTISVSLVESSAIKFTNENNIAEFGRKTHSTHKQLVTDGEGRIKLEDKLAYAEPSETLFFSATAILASGNPNRGHIDSVKRPWSHWHESSIYKLICNGVSYECTLIFKTDEYTYRPYYSLKVDDVIEMRIFEASNHNLCNIDIITPVDGFTEVSLEVYCIYNFKRIDEQFMPVGTVIAPVTMDDNGKILQVVDGVWSVGDIPNNQKDNIKLVDQVNGYTYIICMRNGELVSYRAEENINEAHSTNED